MHLHIHKYHGELQCEFTVLASFQWNTVSCFHRVFKCCLRRFQKCPWGRDVLSHFKIYLESFFNDLMTFHMSHYLTRKWSSWNQSLLWVYPGLTKAYRNFFPQKWEKPDLLDTTHASMERTCTLHTEQPCLGLNSGSSCCGATLIHHVAKGFSEILLGGTVIHIYLSPLPLKSYVYWRAQHPAKPISWQLFLIYCSHVVCRFSFTVNALGFRHECADECLHRGKQRHCHSRSYIPSFYEKDIN